MIFKINNMSTHDAVRTKKRECYIKYIHPIKMQWLVSLVYNLSMFKFCTVDQFGATLMDDECVCPGVSTLEIAFVCFPH